MVPAQFVAKPDRLPIDITHGRVRRIISNLLPTGVNPLQGNESRAFEGSKPTSSFEPVIKVVGRTVKACPY